MSLWRRILSGVLLICSSVYAGEVYIIGTADLHGNIWNLAKLAPVFRRYPEAVKVDGGDSLQGNYAVTELCGNPVIGALNYLNYDVWVPGNHEFEFRQSDFERWAKDFRGTILGAQWQYGSYRPAGHTVIRRGKYRIGLIGLSESGMAAKQHLVPELKWQDEISSLRQAVTALKQEKCHAVILVCHIALRGSYGEIYRLLQAFPEIDAVISGHSHREHYGDQISGRVVAQAASHGRSAVLLTLHFGDDEVLEYTTSRLLFPDGARDKTLVQIARRAERAVYKRAEKYYGDFPDAGYFGNIAAGVLRQAVGADAALVSFNEKYFRCRMTGRSLFDLFPFGNRLVTVTMDAAELRRWGVRYEAPPRRCFVSIAPEISGSRVKVVMSDFLCTRIPELKNAEVEVLPVFERETIAGQLEKLLSGTIL